MGFFVSLYAFAYVVPSVWDAFFLFSTYQTPCAVRSNEPPLWHPPICSKEEKSYCQYCSVWILTCVQQGFSEILNKWNFHWGRRWDNYFCNWSSHCWYKSAQNHYQPFAPGVAMRHWVWVLMVFAAHCGGQKWKRKYILSLIWCLLGFTFLKIL